MKVAFKWRANDTTYLYLTGSITGTTDVDGKPMIFDSLNKECIYQDESQLVAITGVSKSMILETDIAAQVRAMSESEYSAMFDKLKSLAAAYSGTSSFKFMDYTFYYNLENDECVKESLLPICETDHVDVRVDAANSMTLSIASSTTLFMVDGELNFSIAGNELVDITDSAMTVHYGGNNDEINVIADGSNGSVNIEGNSVTVSGNSELNLNGNSVIEIEGETGIDITVNSGNVNIVSNNGEVVIDGSNGTYIEKFQFNETSISSENLYINETTNSHNFSEMVMSRPNEIKPNIPSVGTASFRIDYEKNPSNDNVLSNSMKYEDWDKDGIRGTTMSELKMWPNNVDMSLSTKTKGNVDCYGTGIDMNVTAVTSGIEKSTLTTKASKTIDIDKGDEVGLGAETVNEYNTGSKDSESHLYVKEILPSSMIRRKLIDVSEEYQESPTQTKYAKLTTDFDDIELKAIGNVEISGSSVTINGVSITAISSAITDVASACTTIEFKKVPIGVNGAIVSGEVKPNSITTTYIGDKVVTTDKLADSSVTTLKIADNAVTEDKVADGAITTVKLSDGAVTTDKISDGNVTTAKLVDSAVTNDKLAADAVNTVNIQDSSVTKSKLSSDVQFGLAPIGSIMIWPGSKTDKPDGWMVLPSASTSENSGTCIPVQYSATSSSWVIASGNQYYSSWTINDVEYDDLNEWIYLNKSRIATYCSSNDFLVHSGTPTPGIQKHIILPAMNYLSKVLSPTATTTEYNYYIMRYR